MADLNKRLYRSKSNKVLAGVCGGVGDYLNIDPVLVRLLFIILIPAAGSSFLAYIIAWLIIPEEPVAPKV